MTVIPAIEKGNDIFEGKLRDLASPDDFLVSILFFGTSDPSPFREKELPGYCLPEAWWAIRQVLQWNSYDTRRFCLDLAKRQQQTQKRY